MTAPSKARSTRIRCMHLLSKHPGVRRQPATRHVDEAGPHLRGSAETIKGSEHLVWVAEDSEGVDAAQTGRLGF